MSMPFLYSVLCTEAAFNDAKTLGGINNQRKSQSWSLPLSSYSWGGPHDHSEIGTKGPSHSGCNEEGPHLTPSLKCLLRMGATQQVRSLVKFGSHFAFTSHWWLPGHTERSLRSFPRVLPCVSSAGGKFSLLFSVASLLSCQSPCVLKDRQRNGFITMAKPLLLFESHTLPLISLEPTSYQVQGE